MLEQTRIIFLEYLGIMARLVIFSTWALQVVRRRTEVELIDSFHRIENVHTSVLFIPLFHLR